MIRYMLTATVVALLGATAFAMVRMLNEEAQPDRLLVIVVAIALAAAFLAVMLAIVALQRSHITQRDMRRLVATVETQLRQRPAPAEGAASATATEPPPPLSTPQTLTAPPRPNTPIALADSLPGDADAESNVVRLPRAGARPHETRQPPAAAGEALAEALVATPTRHAELSLQPIVSIANGEARGFDVFRWIAAPDGAGVDIRRIAEPPSGFSIANFERRTIEAAFGAARRRLAGTMAPTPLHVPISEALLASATDIERVTGMLRQYPVMQASVVLSLPAPLLGSDHAPALARLAEAGFGFTIEAEADPIRSLLSNRAVRFVRLPVTRLISRGRLRKGRQAGLPILEEAAAAGIPVIAGDVAHDDDAVMLLDLGVDLMTGERFSAPRRLKPDMRQPQQDPSAAT